MLLELVRGKESPDVITWREGELEDLLAALDRRQLDRTRVVRVLWRASFTSQIDTQQTSRLNQFLAWSERRDRVLARIERIPEEVRRLYEEFTAFLRPLDTAGQLPEPTARLKSLAATLAAIDQLLDALRHDEVLGIQGAGRERGRQPARAVAEARAQLKHAGVPTAIANGLLILYKIVPTRST